MNAQGISTFYGAEDVETALAEVRPPVGCKVLVGRFAVLGSIQLLDLEALTEISIPGSIFDPSYGPELERAAFLSTLESKMGKAVLPHEETSAYLTTQVIAEYLAMEAKLDGILFPSVQRNGAARNVVLFHHASKVKRLEIPPGTEVRVHLYEQHEDGYDFSPTVIEEVPSQAPSEGAKESDPFGFPPNRFGEKDDSRKPTLAVDTDSIRVHSIKAVEIAHKSTHISRHRWKKTDGPHPF